MSAILLLGPQFRAPCLRAALQTTGLQGPFYSITAGWQEREGEVDELAEHLGAPVTDLRLYERAETVFARDPEFQASYRERQRRLRQMQDLYRVRLEHAKHAWRELAAVEAAPDLMTRSRRSALTALRRLDREHLAQTGRIHGEFEREWHTRRRTSLVSEAGQLHSMIARAGTILIAGGHVAVLLNRLALFDMGRLLAAKPIAAWSAGAQVLTQIIVLFHDHPPHGSGHAEVFESGLGLVRDLVAFPHAGTRLALDEPERIALLARRFAPSICMTFDTGEWVRCASGQRVCGSARQFARNGRLESARAPGMGRA
jgi:hypothetical protein